MGFVEDICYPRFEYSHERVLRTPQIVVFAGLKIALAGSDKQKSPGRLPRALRRKCRSVVEGQQNPVVSVESCSLELRLLLRLRGWKCKVQVRGRAQNYAKEVLIAILVKNQLVYAGVILFSDSAAQHGCTLLPV